MQCSNQSRTHRVLTVLTFRPEFNPPWGLHSHIISISLSHLACQQARAIVEQISDSKTLPEEVLTQIIQKTDGVPLFVEELTKAVLESGLLREEEGGYKQRAVERSANVEAIAHLTKGLELLKSTPDSAERGRLELDLQIAFGTALLAT